MLARIARPFMLLAVILTVGLGAYRFLKGRTPLRTDHVTVVTFAEPEFVTSLENLNEALNVWAKSLEVQPAERADNLTIARRISLGLVGSGLSLEEIRALQSVPDNKQIAWLTNYLLQDRRWSNYFADRFSRAMLGVDDGPFLLFRRGRFKVWMSDQLLAGTGYDSIVRDVLASEGLWTDKPQVNFITASMSQESQSRCDPIVLTGRTSRAFLAQRIDCLQCHDDFLGQHDFGLGDDSIPGEQMHFHQLAAFFGGTGLKDNVFAGIRETGQIYTATLQGSTEETQLEPAVPFLPELLPAEGKPRDRLAAWITHRDNFAFSRATVNRVWAILFSRPLVEEVDSIPLDGSVPAVLDLLARDFTRNKFDLRRLVKLIVSSDAFQRQSKAKFELTPIHERCYAAFPITQLQPEQVARSIVQASRLTSINAESSSLTLLAAFDDRSNFLRAFGDRGVDEFTGEAITIPQRLVLMNGRLVSERTKDDIVMNAATRIAKMVSTNEKAAELIFLTVLGRFPTTQELERIAKYLGRASGQNRTQAVSDVYWAILNSTEFCWNH